MTRADPGTRLVLVDADGSNVAKGTTDDYGSLIFYDIEPAVGFRVIRDGEDDPEELVSLEGPTTTVEDRSVRGSDPFVVPSGADHPPTTLYTSQPLQRGLNYIRMRDDITLAMTVRLPPGKELDDGPFPTLIEYSGYDVAAPSDLLASIAARLADPEAPPDPLAPSSSTAVGAVIGPLLDFAVVSVQIRGTGCSGGAFDLFGLPTVYDGYDAVETVAAQPWVKGGKVGMVGISYSGISQLFVGGTRPPHLAALAPMSVTADLYQGVGFPGGIFNTGFAKGWLTERQEDAKAASDGGQAWAAELIAGGDKHCEANQLLHHQARDGLAELADVEFREPRLFAQRTPAAWAKDIDVPTFIIGGLQDEQLGSYWATMIPSLLDRPDTWVTMYNGNHNDALQPAVLTRWAEFLNLFVADRITRIPEAVLGFSRVLFDQIAHVPAEALEQSRFAAMTNVSAARDRFRKDPAVRVLLDVGGTDLGAGSLAPSWELTADTWPIEGTKATRYHLGDGTLSTAEPTTDAAEATYDADPAARPETSLDPSVASPFADQPNKWTPISAGSGLGWISAPLSSDTLIAGGSSLDLRLTASEADTDLQATLTEVRPDGQETYVGSGWLRASHHKLDESASTATEPRPTHLATDRSTLDDDAPTLVRVGIDPTVHAFRAGSRIRVTLSAPGGDRSLWKWDTIDDGTTKVTVHSTVAEPSALVLPVIQRRTAGAPLPACGVLRGQPCRAYVPATNGG